MKEQIKDILRAELSRQDNLNRIREYIQSYFLYILYKKKFYRNFIFTGGTALRFIYKIPRFSEDLDFSLSERCKKYDFIEFLKDTRKEFELSGYTLEIKYSIQKTVHSAFFKFPDILFEMGLSRLRDEKISVKIEIDTNPPKGGAQESTLYNLTFMFYMFHYDLPSLFAGKICALLARKYTKGRDWYDLLWYMSKFKTLEPNFIFLNNALKQIRESPLSLSKENWKDELKKTIEKLDIAKVRNDVFRFLENHSDVRLLNKENLLNVISK